MRVLGLTGVPGTGKTTVADHLPESVTVVRANDLAAEVDAIVDRDEDRQADIVDEGILQAKAREVLPETDVVIEGGLAHFCDPDMVVVLRCHPDTLRDRMAGRGWSEAKVEENVMAETLNVIASEVDTRPAWEIDTTDAQPAQIAAHTVALLKGESLDEPIVHHLGGIDWSHTLMGEQPG